MPGSCHIQIRSGFLVIYMSPVSNVFTISDALCSMDVFCKRISWPLGVENESCESNFASQSGYQMFQLTEVKNTHCPSGKTKTKVLVISGLCLRKERESFGHTRMGNFFTHFSVALGGFAQRNEFLNSFSSVTNVQIGL